MYKSVEDQNLINKDLNHLSLREYQLNKLALDNDHNSEWSHILNMVNTEAAKSDALSQPKLATERTEGLSKDLSGFNHHRYLNSNPYTDRAIFGGGRGKKFNIKQAERENLKLPPLMVSNTVFALPKMVDTLA